MDETLETQNAERNQRAKMREMKKKREEEEERKRMFAELMDRLARLPYKKAKIRYAVDRFTISFRRVFRIDLLPKGTREQHINCIRNAKMEFLKKHFSEEMEIGRSNGKWTCCQNRVDMLTTIMPRLIKYKNIPPGELKRFTKVKARMAAEISTKGIGDPPLDRLLEPLPTEVSMNGANELAATSSTPVTKTKKKKKKLNGVTRNSPEVPYLCVPIAHALDNFNFAKKFRLAFSCSFEFGSAVKFKKRQTIMRTKKFRFLMRHFRSAIKLKRVDGNWTCCQNSFDALDPEPVINKIDPTLLLPFVRLTEAESLALLMLDPRKPPSRIAENGPNANNKPHWSEDGELITHGSSEPSQIKNPMQPPEKKPKKKRKKTSKSTEQQSDESFVEILPPPTPEPVEEIVVPSDSETSVFAPSPKKAPPDPPPEPPNQVAIEDPEPPVPDIVATDDPEIPPVKDPVRPAPSISVDLVIPIHVPVSNGPRKGAKRKLRILSSSSEDESPLPAPRQSRAEVKLKPCSVTLDRLPPSIRRSPSPPGLRETREWKTYKRIRANKPLVVEDVRHLMIGAETVRQRLNSSDSESDVEFNPKAVRSSEEASSCSESVLSHETASPQSPDTESAGAESETYGASELEEEEERRRHFQNGRGHPFVIEKTVEERRQLREQRKQHRKRRLQRKHSRQQYEKTFLGHLSYAPTSLRYAVDTVTKKLKWDVFPFGAKVLGRTLGKKELDSLSKSQQSTEWTVLKQAFVLKHFPEVFRIKKDPKGDGWTCCRNAVDFLDCKAFLKIFWNINVT